MTTDFATRFVNDLNAKFTEDIMTFSLLRGRRYTRIVAGPTPYAGSGASCYAFVENDTGYLIKAAGWSAPQRDKDGLAVRYQLAHPEDYERAINDADPYAAFLYKKD